MGSKKAKASAVSSTHEGTAMAGVGAGVNTLDRKQLSEKEKVMDRVQWLRTLAGQLLQEASELEAKWGSSDAGDAMSVDGPADTVDVAAGIKDETNDGPAGLLKKKAKKNKKTNKKNTAADTEINAKATQTKTTPALSQTADGQGAETPGVVKSKKDKKRKRQSPGDDAPAGAGETSAPVKSSNLAQDAGSEWPREQDSKKAKKELKKMKKATKEKDNKPAQGTGAAGASSNNDAPRPIHATDRWNVKELGGGAERQNKFLKLLGGGNAASSPAAQVSGDSRPKYDVQKSQDDIQKQYDATMRMKFEGQGQRRGLGA